VQIKTEKLIKEGSNPFGVIDMNKEKIAIAVVCMTATFLALNCVTANPRTSYTPLYTFRIEQASSEMNFLPTTVNEISYDATNGYIFPLETENARLPGYQWHWTIAGPTCFTPPSRGPLLYDTCYPDLCPWMRLMPCDPWFDNIWAICWF